MDKLMQKAMEKHKIVRYQQTFIDVMTTYKSLLEAENEQLHKPVVMQDEGSDGVSEAAVGNSAAGQSGSGGFYCISGKCEKQCLYCQ